jgi:predicted O-methyltransferase YrrM
MSGRILRLQPSRLELELTTNSLARADAFASGMMDDGELKFLAAVTHAFPWSGGDLVVEIGTHTGRTAVFLAETLAEIGSDSLVLSIDPFERVEKSRLNPQGKYRKYVKTMREHGLQDRCVVLVGFSHHVAPAVSDRIGLLLVDGNHDYASVRQDLALYGPKVLPGGFVFLDDYTGTYPGVVKATEEYVAGHEDFVLLHRSYFAILQRAG